MTGYTVPRGRCRPVDFDLADRCAAIRALLRIEEVAHLWTPATGDEEPAPVAEQVLLHFSEEFSRGRLRYVADPRFVDCWCSPLKTLRRGYGDCDDLAILATAALICGGVKAEVVIGRVGAGHASNHAWVEGLSEDGVGFFYEPTSPTLMHRYRPPSYEPHALVDQNSCVDLRDRERRQRVIRAAAGVGLVALGAGLIVSALSTDE